MEKKYIMENRDTGAVIQTTEKYMPHWIARGFTVKEIKLPALTLGT